MLKQGADLDKRRSAHSSQRARDMRRHESLWPIRSKQMSGLLRWSSRCGRGRLRLLLSGASTGLSCGRPLFRHDMTLCAVLVLFFVGSMVRLIVGGLRRILGEKRERERNRDEGTGKYRWLHGSHSISHFLALCAQIGAT